jgi:hypothetical protein
LDRKTGQGIFQLLSGQTRLEILITFFSRSANHDSSEMPQTWIFSVDVINSPAMEESLIPGKKNPSHRLCNFAIMSKFVTENNIHRPWAAEEDVLFLVCIGDMARNRNIS